MDTSPNVQANTSCHRTPSGLPQHQHGVRQEVRHTAHSSPEPLQHELDHQGSPAEERDEEIIH